MQTFLPYPRFDASAAVLDDQRLGKQRVETLQILRALVWPSYRGWKNHPATAMWRGFTPALVSYGIAMCDEWERRGHADAVRLSLLEFVVGEPATQADLARAGRTPPWLGSLALHRSHRAALARKLPEHYGRWFGDVDVDEAYYWPRPLVRRWPISRDQLLNGQDAVTGALADEAAVTALATPGPVVWVRGDPNDAPTPPVAELQPPVTDSPPGRVSPSIARPPTAEDLAAVEAQATATPWLLGYRLSALADRRVRAALPRPALVVLEDAEPARRHFRGIPTVTLPSPC